MAELDDRLRDAVRARSDVYAPPHDLADRIAARVARRDRRRRAVAGVAVTAAAAVLVAAFVLLRGGDEAGKVRIDGAPPRPAMTETTAPATTERPTDTTGRVEPPPTTASTIPMSAGPSSQTRQGWGAARAGMTVREAQAAGVQLTLEGAGTGTCREAGISGALDGVRALVEPAGGDPLDGTVRAFVGSVAPSEDGAMVGQTRAELIAALGPPTGSTSAALGEVLLFEQGGYAYGALVVDDLVLGLQSGDPEWVHLIDGCAG